MIRTLANRLSRLTLVAVGAGLLQLSSPVLADSRTNHCNRFAGQKAVQWFSTDRHIEAARQAAAALVNASSHGLDPADYNANALARQFTRLEQERNGNYQAFNKAFTRSVLCYLQNVSTGRLRPHAIHQQIWLPKQKFNQARLVNDALANDSIAALLSGAAPQSEDYKALYAQLPALQKMAREEGDLSALRIKGRVKVEPGQSHRIIPAVRARLAFLGDLGAIQPDPMDSIAVAADSTLLDPMLASALARFQARHGLIADRILGRGALRALQVPVASRVAQVELAMERIRWYPRDHGNRVVRVNIPAYTMTASAPDQDGEFGQLDSRVIVGKPGRRHTPLFAGPITRIEFSPTWYVPQSIAQRAILPTIRRNPGYMRKRDFEFRLPNGRTTQRVTKSMLKRVANNEVRLQQRSGPHNALGRVKFILPNSRAIFLHDTNKRKLFDRDARALSYGCVRVEKPLALAELLLADQPQWSRTAIDKAVAERKTVKAHTSEETTVMLQYMTAEVSATGAIQFMPDIYAMDKAAIQPVKRWRNGVQPSETDWRLLAQLQGLEQAG